MTYKRISYIITAVFSIQIAYCQNLTPRENKYLYDYLSLPPIERVSYIRTQAPFVSVTGFSNINEDIISLCGIDIKKEADIAIGGVIGALYSPNDSLFKRCIDSVYDLISQKSYLKIQRESSLDINDTASKIIILAYLKNSPMERISFIENNFNRIPSEILKLMQLDLDRVLSTKTQSICCNRKRFLKVKRTWLNKGQAERFKMRY